MKYSFVLMAVVIFSCSGSLSDDQRKRIKESMEQGEIKKVSEAQITEAAFTYGRHVASILERRDSTLTNTALQDSLSKELQIEIISLQSGNQQMRGVELQIIEAYMEGSGSNDNIQKMGVDTLLYTKPILRENTDGSTEFLKAIGIRMTRKQIVLSIKE